MTKRPLRDWIHVIYSGYDGLQGCQRHPRHDRLHGRGDRLRRTQAPLQPRQRDAQHLGVRPGRCAHQRHGVGLERADALNSRHSIPRLPEASRQVHQRGDFLAHEGNCEIDTIEHMESLANQIGNKRLTYAKLVRKNGLSSTVMPV